MTSTERAIHELELAGLFDADSDYGGMIGQSVKELLELFSEQGHSGFSAGLTADLFHRLVRGETLTPNDHTDHRNVSEYFSRPTLQDNRDPRWFSDDEGKCKGGFASPVRYYGRSSPSSRGTFDDHALQLRAGSSRGHPAFPGVECLESHA